MKEIDFEQKRKRLNTFENYILTIDRKSNYLYEIAIEFGLTDEDENPTDLMEILSKQNQGESFLFYLSQNLMRIHENIGTIAQGIDRAYVGYHSLPKSPED